jgi:hypothetical protein
MMWGVLFGLAWTALTTGGCTSMMPAAKVPETRMIHTADHPQAVYRKALSTAIAMGTAIQVANEHSRVFQGTLHNAVVLTGEVTEEKRGGVIKITATVLPNKLAFGALTEADDFVRAYNAQ